LTIVAADAVPTKPLSVTCLDVNLGQRCARATLLPHMLPWRSRARTRDAGQPCAPLRPPPLLLLAVLLSQVGHSGSAHIVLLSVRVSVCCVMLLCEASQAVK